MSEHLFLELFKEIIVNRKKKSIETNDKKDTTYRQHIRMVNVLYKNRLLEECDYEWLINACMLPLDELYENSDYNL